MDCFCLLFVPRRVRRPPCQPRLPCLLSTCRALTPARPATSPTSRAPPSWNATRACPRCAAPTGAMCRPGWRALAASQLWRQTPSGGLLARWIVLQAPLGRSCMLGLPGCWPVPRLCSCFQHEPLLCVHHYWLQPRTCAGIWLAAVRLPSPAAIASRGDSRESNALVCYHPPSLSLPSTHSCRLPELSVEERKRLLNPEEPVWSRPSAGTLSGSWRGVRWAAVRCQQRMFSPGKWSLITFINGCCSYTCVQIACHLPTWIQLTDIAPARPLPACPCLACREESGRLSDGRHFKRFWLLPGAGGGQDKLLVSSCVQRLAHVQKTC